MPKAKSAPKPVSPRSPLVSPPSSPPVPLRAASSIPPPQPSAPHPSQNHPLRNDAVVASCRDSVTRILRNLRGDTLAFAGMVAPILLDLGLLDEANPPIDHGFGAVIQDLLLIPDAPTAFLTARATLTLNHLVRTSGIRDPSVLLQSTAVILAIAHIHHTVVSPST